MHGNRTTTASLLLAVLAAFSGCMTIVPGKENYNPALDTGKHLTPKPLSYYVLYKRPEWEGYPIDTRAQTEWVADKFYTIAKPSAMFHPLVYRGHAEYQLFIQYNLDSRPTLENTSLIAASTLGFCFSLGFAPIYIPYIINLHASLVKNGVIIRTYEYHRDISTYASLIIPPLLENSPRRIDRYYDIIYDDFFMQLLADMRRDGALESESSE